MPYIGTTTTVNISEEKREALKTLLGKAIELIPGKSEKFLMLSFDDNKKMYFAGNNDGDTAFVDVKIFGTAEKSAYDALTAEITRIYSKELGLLPARIYVKYEECFNWGWNGANF